MSFNTRLLESIDIVTAFAPSDLNTDATGDWVSLKNYEGCLIVIHKAAGTAGDDISILTEQATDVAGTSAKALNFTHLYYKVGATALSGVSTFSKVTGTATNDLDTVTAFGTDLAADTGEALLVVDIRASDLDVGGGFDCLRWSSEGDDVGNSTYGASVYILYGARYPQATPLTSITD
jgi:hypothetical protein